MLKSCLAAFQYSLEFPTTEGAVKVFVGLPLLPLAFTEGKMVAGAPESQQEGHVALSLSVGKASDIIKCSVVPGMVGGGPWSLACPGAPWCLSLDSSFCGQPSLKISLILYLTDSFVSPAHRPPQAGPRFPLPGPASTTLHVEMSVIT